MAVSRYRNINIINNSYFASSDFPTQRQLDEVPVLRIRIGQFHRLDQLSAKYLGDGSYWWVIAVMNNLQWAFGFEAGQIIKIPIDVNDVLRFF